MTDKVQKIREEVERLKSLIGNNSFLSDYEKGCNDGREDMCEELLSFMDSLLEEPVSENLEEAAEKYAYELFPSIGVPNTETELAFKAGAQWQKEQEQETIELAEDHAMFAGMEKMKEQMMAKAVDATVHIDAGGYPYIPQMELYDYDKDVPLAKEGDKYKVVLIKEDEL